MAFHAPSRRVREIEALLKSIEVRTNALMHVVEEYNTDLGRPQDVRAFLGWSKVILGDILTLTVTIRKKFEDK